MVQYHVLQVVALAVYDHVPVNSVDTDDTVETPTSHFGDVTLQKGTRGGAPVAILEAVKESLTEQQRRTCLVHEGLRQR